MIETKQRPCSAIHPEPSPGSCRLCWLFINDDQYRVMWGGNAQGRSRKPKPVRRSLNRQSQNLVYVPPPTRRPLPCIHLGHVTSYCPYGNPLLNVHWCYEFDELCTRGHSGVRSCETCPGYDHGQKLNFPIHFDQTNLAVGVKGLRFNPSLIEWKGGYLFAFRDGWAGSDIWLVPMNLDFQQISGPVSLPLATPASSYGREDPRLFMFRGKIHISFIGVEGKGWSRRQGGIKTNQLYACLSDNLEVEEIFYPQIPGRQEWEKNIVSFEHDGELYAIYSIAPHRIARVRSNEWQWVYETPFGGKWGGGFIRGGASPILFNGSWYHFVHGKATSQRGLTYSLGCVVFENQPPFKITRYTPEPLLWADWSINDQKHNNYCACIWPGGAMVQGENWIIACGRDDRDSEIHAFAISDVEARLKAL